MPPFTHRVPYPSPCACVSHAHWCLQSDVMPGLRWRAPPCRRETLGRAAQGRPTSYLGPVCRSCTARAPLPCPPVPSRALPCPPVPLAHPPPWSTVPAHTLVAPPSGFIDPPPQLRSPVQHGCGVIADVRLEATPPPPPRVTAVVSVLHERALPTEPAGFAPCLGSPA